MANKTFTEFAMICNRVGREKIDISPSMSDHGHSAGSGHSGGGKSGPIHIHVHSTLNVDGKRMAEVVSEHIDDGIGGYTG
jgi:hypothetical protein